MGAMGHFVHIYRQFNSDYVSKRINRQTFAIDIVRSWRVYFFRTRYRILFCTAAG